MVCDVHDTAGEGVAGVLQHSFNTCRRFFFVIVGAHIFRSAQKSAGAILHPDCQITCLSNPYSQAHVLNTSQNPYLRNSPKSARGKLRAGTRRQQAARQSTRSKLRQKPRQQKCTRGHAQLCGEVQKLKAFASVDLRPPFSAWTDREICAENLRE